MPKSTEDRYLIVSTDGHAGLLPEKYCDYVDPKHRDVFEKHVAAEVALRAEREKDFLIKDFNDKWRSGNEANPVFLEMFGFGKPEEELAGGPWRAAVLALGSGHGQGFGRAGRCAA